MRHYIYVSQNQASNQALLSKKHKFTSDIYLSDNISLTGGRRQANMPERTGIALSTSLHA